MLLARIRPNSVKNPARHSAPEGFQHQPGHLVQKQKPSLRLLPDRVRADTLLFALALAVYLATRLAGLSSYPIYFFTDEAVQTVLADEFIDRGARGSDGLLFPTYFLNSYQYNLGTSVYLQVLPTLIFGKSVFVTRAASLLVTALAAGWLGLILKKVFGSTRPWLGVLVLSITPAWFLHSRTAFETALAASLFTGFLYFYLLYRKGEVKKIYLAVLLGALTFYAYSPIRMVLAVCVLLFLVSDIRYHWQQRKTIAAAFGMTLVSALPLLRFQLVHPEETLRHLQVLNSYWIQNISWGQKLALFGKEYLSGLNPLYWFFSNDHDLARHQMDGYGHIFWFMLPFVLLGIVLAISRIRQPAYRILLFAFLAAPSGAALVKLGITRILVMVIPMSLLGALAINWLLDKVPDFRRRIAQAASLGVFGLLAGINIFLCVQALTVGALWSQDYGLGGMQYGARQLTAAINKYLDENPGTPILVSPSWANGTDTTMRFFYQDGLPFGMGSVEGYFNERRDDIENTVFVMIPDEYRQVVESDKFTGIQVIQVLPYPNGEPGFYFVRMRYADNFDDILVEEKAARQVLQEEVLEVQGMETWVSYSYLDMGSISYLFDGDDLSLVRSLEANPLQVNLEWDTPRQIERILMRIGGATTTLSLEGFNASGDSILDQTYEIAQDPNPRTITVELPGRLSLNRLEIDVKNTYDSEPSHVHLWEITLQ
ncbi:MAG: glycosyltransferase family 39 protein [Anaerolineaceae bacterium]|nr:glycosyltransferase family 39 protein [Anaerolineaceae bacterium]